MSKTTFIEPVVITEHIFDRVLVVSDRGCFIRLKESFDGRTEQSDSSRRKVELFVTTANEKRLPDRVTHVLRTGLEQAGAIGCSLDIPSRKGIARLCRFPVDWLIWIIFPGIQGKGMSLVVWYLTLGWLGQVHSGQEWPNKGSGWGMNLIQEGKLLDYNRGFKPGSRQCLNKPNQTQTVLQKNVRERNLSCFGVWSHVV